MRMPFSKDNLAVLGIVAVLTATYVLVVYRPQSAVLNGYQAQAHQERMQMEQDSNKAKQVPPMLREIETMKQRYNKDWDRRLPQSKELAGFLREIAGNLAQSNLNNSITQPGNPFKGPLYTRFPITMRCDGDFLSLTSFLRSVDQMSRLTRIEKVSIKPNEKDESLAIELGMNIYFTEQ